MQKFLSIAKTSVFAELNKPTNIMAFVMYVDSKVSYVLPGPLIQSQHHPVPIALQFL